MVTKKIRKVDSLTIQQSDYVSLWADDNLEANAPKSPDKYAEEPLWDRWPLRYAYRPYFLLKNSLSILNPALKKVKFD